MNHLTTILIIAGGGLAAVVVVVVVVLALWLRARRRAADWAEAWGSLDRQPATALRIFEDFAPKRSRPPKNPKKRSTWQQARYGQAICHVRLNRPDEADHALRDSSPYRPQTKELVHLCEAFLAASHEPARPAAVENWARLLALPADAATPEVRSQVEAALLEQIQSQPADTPEQLESRLALALKVSESTPQWPAAHRERGYILCRQARWPEAIAAFDAALSITPDQLDLLRALAQALREAGDRGRLRETLLAIQRLEPSATAAYDAALITLQLADQQPGDLPVAAQPAGEITADSSDAAPAIAVVEAPDYLAEAHELLQSATQLDPKHAPAWMALSRTKWRRGDREAAVRTIEQALAIDATVAEGFALLGEYQIAAGDLASARQSLARAMDLDPSAPAALRHLGDLEFAEGKYPAALAHYGKLPPESRDDHSLQDRLARCYLETGRPEAAVELLAGRQTLEPPARLVLARSQARLGRWEDALKTYRAVRLPAPSAEWNYYYAAALAANGKTQEAEALFAALRKDPAWKDKARRQLGHLRLLQGQAAQASELYRGANGDVAYTFDLGRAALISGDPQQARQLFAKSTNGDAPASRFAVAYAEAELGNPVSLQSLTAGGGLSADALEVVANRAFESRRYADALPAYEQVIARRTSVPTRILERLAAGYVHLRRDREALTHLVELVKRKPADVGLRTNLALCRWRLGRLAFSKSQWEAARREFTQARDLIAASHKDAAAALLEWAIESAFREVLRILEQASNQPAQIKKAVELCKFGCDHASRDLRWQLTAGIVTALAGEFATSIKHFEAARAISPRQPQVLLGLAISQHEKGQSAQAQKTLGELLALLDKSEAAPGIESLRVTARFAQVMAASRDQQWSAAAEALTPLLTHPLIAKSSKLTPRDVAQVALAYYAAAGNKEKASELAKTYLPDVKGLGDVLIGLVQADAKDFAGAAATLGRAYASDKNPKVLKVLVGCVLAVAAGAVLKGDLKSATDSVGQALRYDPQNKAAKSLHDALNFAGSLKSLNLAQLDDAIRQCQQQMSAGDQSPDLVRSLANLFHRKAVQAEKNNREPDAAWNTCLTFWTKNIVQSQPFWSKFVESYNTGRSRREQIKEDEVSEVRTALPGLMVDAHTEYAKDYRQNRSENGLVRHLNLIWQWQSDFKPSDDFLFALVNVREMDDWQADMLEKASNRFTNQALRNEFRKRLAIYWYNTGGAILMEIIEDMKAGLSWRVEEKGKRAKSILTRAYNLDPTDSDIRDLYNLARDKF
jgi:tetratricopeptide (TPR) repeat protein